MILASIDSSKRNSGNALVARITTILDEAAERFQIVLLTCHPERYRGLPNAHFFDLETLA